MSSNDLPNGGLMYRHDQPTDNGGPMSAFSGSAVVGAGGRFVGEGRPMPPTQPQQSAMPPQQAARAPMPQGQQGGVPSPQAAANAIRTPPTQPTANAVPPQQRAQNAVPTQQAAAANQQLVAAIPAGLPSACGKKPDGIAGANFDCDTINNLGGEVKCRIITCGDLVTPSMIKKRSIQYRLDDVRADILKHKITADGERVGNLERVIIVGLELIAAKNELPFQVSFNMSGTKGRDYCWRTKERALLIMPPRYSESGVCRKLHMHAPNVSISAFRRFGRIKASQINDGIVKMPNEEFSWVHTSSPVAGVIRASHEALKPTLANVRVTENYMPVTDKLVMNIQKFLHDKISSFPGTNMSQGAITFCRSTANNFCDSEGLEGDSRMLGYELSKACAVYVKFHLYYVILSNTAQVREICGPAPTANSANPIFQNHRAAGAEGLPGAPAAQLAGV